MIYCSLCLADALRHGRPTTETKGGRKAATVPRAVTYQLGTPVCEDCNLRIADAAEAVIGFVLELKEEMNG